MKISKYNKTSMGYWLDARRAMARIETVSREWCKAFDAGDAEALAMQAELWAEALKDYSEAINIASKLQEEEMKSLLRCSMKWLK